VSGLSGFFHRILNRRQGDRGAVSALTALAILPIVAVTAVGVDSGRVYVENQRVKTASEAGAVAAAGAWVQSGTACTERALSFVEANAGDSTVSDCSTAGTRYSGVVTVSASKDVSALFGNLVGRESTTVDSTASVRVRPVGGMNGLRPTALCENSPGLVAWRASGFSTTQIFSVDFSGTCGDIPGNWGVLDFDGGSNRTVDLQTWINAGYPGLVSIGQEFNGDPGIPSPALNMDSVVGETITVPVFDRSRLQGSTSVFHVSSFVQMEVIAVQLNGSASSRNISVRFKVGSLSGARIGESASNNGVVTWSPCQLDGRGDCS
jgi:Flp pilus assembly protein TadG